MPISNPLPTTELTIAETQVFSGTSPTTWTDLNLSSVIGANPALVQLKVSNSGYAFATVAFRKKGETDEFYDATKALGCQSVGTTTGDHYVVWVATDSSGVIQWITNSAQANTTVDVMAYIK